jgi:hypothetical protein
MHTTMRSLIVCGTLALLLVAGCAETSATKGNPMSGTGNAGAVRREGGKVWIDGVKGFDPCQYTSSVHGSQARILQVLGEKVGYDDLVCYSAFAFRVQWHQQGCPSAAHPGPGYTCLEGSNRAIPWRMAIYEDAPWNKQPQSGRTAFEAKVREAVRASIDRGIPVHYGSEEDGLIIGYGDGGRRWLCVHPYSKDGAEQFWHDEAKDFAGGKWPWGVVVWTEPQSPSERTSERDLLIAALRQAVDMWKTRIKGDYFCGEAAYEQWLAYLHGVETGEVKDPKTGMQGNAWCFDVLAQNRQIAGRWLAAKAQGLDGEAGKQLAVAAGHYEALSEGCMKDLKCTWELALPPQQFDKWTSALRKEQIRRLQAAREHDRAAVAAIEQALAAIKP